MGFDSAFILIVSNDLKEILKYHGVFFSPQIRNDK